MVDELSGTCTFTFDFDGVEGDDHAWDDGGGVWECPHDAAVENLCPFHASPDAVDDNTVAVALVETLAGHDDVVRQCRAKQFVGARFGGLDLEFARVDADDNYPLDLRHAHFEGVLDCAHAVFTEPVDLRGATVEGDTSLVDAHFHHDVWLEGATFGGDLNCYDVQFDDDAHLAGITVRGEADFHDASFREECDLQGARFEGPLDVHDATFGDEATFADATFADSATFTEAEFEDACNLEDACADADLSFAGATFDERLVVADVSGAGGTVDLGGATIRGGELAWECGERRFDLTEATVGDVDLAVTDGRAFEGLHVEETQFDGFDFGRYIDDLASAEWRIHGSDAADAGTDHTDSPGTVETTYVKAKNGAKAAGNDRVAAEFFIREMTARRDGHRHRLLDGDLPLARRLRAGAALVGNLALRVTTGYGERPSRVVAFSVCTVFAFAALFAVAMPMMPYDTPVGYLVVSATAFVTLVLGGGEPITDPWVRLLAEVEGFAGAFLIALFVFTLTRSINR